MQTIRLSLGMLLCASVNHHGAEGGDPSGDRNIAGQTALPSGAGLAQAFPADRGIAAHPAVVFVEDFERAGYATRWDEIRDPKEQVLDLVDESGADPRLGSRSLKVEARLSQNTGGGLTKWFESAPTLFFRFYVKFSDDCDYIHHFCTLRANQGLRGSQKWSGFGGAGQKPRGDERFSTALEPWGNWGRWTPPGRWNFYSYWHEMTASGDGKFWGNAFRPAQQEDIPRGRWICAEFMLKHNDPGEPNGEQAYWIDGQLLGHWQGINWRKNGTLWANAFTLESYVTDRWTKQETNVVFFDNVVFAREYIGPALAP